MPKPKIAIVYYSMYGHVRTLALAEKEGLEAAGCEVTLLKVPETLSDEVLGKLGAPGVGKDDEEASAPARPGKAGAAAPLAVRRCPWSLDRGPRARRSNCPSGRGENCGAGRGENRGAATLL